MAADRRLAVNADQEITTARAKTSSGEVWVFFDDIHDVTNLSPHEEAGEAWEATVATERVGMAVVDTFPPNHTFVFRVAVLEPFRRMGVGTALLTTLQEEYGRLACRVHEQNDASRALVRSVGFQRVECRFHELEGYDTHETDEA